MKKVILIILFIILGSHFALAEEHTVACTMDAQQCPDGTWIGRTGPHCEFDCSAHQETKEGTEKKVVVHPSYVGVAVPVEKHSTENKKDLCASQGKQVMCGQPPIPECLKDDAPYKCRMPMPLPRTYTNRCYLDRDNAEWLHDGKCHGDFSDTKENKEVKTIPENCKTWFDGCNTCVRDEKTKEMLCTMKACMHQETPACMEYFEEKGGDITDETNTTQNEKPTAVGNREENTPRIIEKIQTKKLFGLIPITLKTQLEVDKTTGQIIRERKPWYAFLLF